ncbi:paraquat-inducible protein A [Planctomycetota bacterium]|nr:paraquat-inducible protein A [Planctomycetota bacterium]
MSSRVALLSATALTLFPAAVLLPVFKVEQFGRVVEASLWSGSLGLLGRGEILVGLVVLVCSLCLPVLKLSSLLLVTAGRRWLAAHHRRLGWRLVEWTGRWGMLDVLLVAVLVAWMKMGDLVEFTVGPGLWVFAAVVLLSLTASAQYDPHALWEDPDSA